MANSATTTVTDTITSPSNRFTDIDDQSALEWDTGVPYQWMSGDYELAYEGAEHLVRAVPGAKRSSYRPLERATLPEELAQLANADDRKILSFVKRNGLLSGGVSESLVYIRREARAVHLVFELLVALERANGDDASPELEQKIRDLVGRRVYNHLRRNVPKPPWIKAVWRECPEPPSTTEPQNHAPVAVTYPGVIAAVIPPPEPVVDWRQEQRERDIHSFGFATDPGGEIPGRLESGDQDSPGAIARFVVCDLLNTPRIDPSQKDYRRGGAWARRTIEVRNGRLISTTSTAPLINAVYWLLMGIATKAASIRICQGCDGFFVLRDGRQRFCTRPAGWGEGESPCANRYRTKLSRQRASRRPAS